MTEPATRFSWRHLLALLFAVTVTLAVFLLRKQIQQFEQYGYLGAFLTMLLGNATIVLPAPGLIIVFVLGGVLNPLLVGLAAGPGAALGEMTAYAAGFSGSAVIDNTRWYQRIQYWMKQYGLIIIVFLAAVPNPLFDLAGIVAGTMQVRWWHFLLSAWIGKTIQAVIIAYAGEFSLLWVMQLLA